jgi:hypothetical protein
MKTKTLSKRTRSPKPACPEEADSLASITDLLGLFFLAEKFPHRQFDTSELAVLSGLGRSMISRIKNAADTPFSGGKCTMRRLDCWLRRHPGFKRD